MLNDATGRLAQFEAALAFAMERVMGIGSASLSATACIT
jgi:hypothetical protein